MHSLHVLFPLLLIPAKLLEGMARRVRLPGVVGSLAAGLLLGPAILGILPAESGGLDEAGALQQLAQIGLCVLLFKIGLETRLSVFLSVWRPATMVAIAGMIVPFLLAWGAGLAVGWTQQQAIFVGATLTATSIGVTASVLQELRAQRSTEGTIILGAAVLDDVLGLLLLSGLVAAFSPAMSVTGAVSKSLVLAIAFLVAGGVLGPIIVKGVVIVSRWGQSRAVVLVLAFSYFLLLAYAAQAIGLDMIIGAYAAGVAFARHPDREQLESDLRPLVELMTPLFFVLLGAAVSLDGFSPLTPSGRMAWAWVALLVVVAALGKLLAAFALRRRAGLNRWAIGSGMMPRGEVGFVFAGVGLSSGVFGEGLFSILLIVLVATTVLGPLLLRMTWRPGEGTPPHGTPAASPPAHVAEHPPTA